ncbi:hypothetical protein FHR83_002525 [Actinoplanes campanulatus]|uniref:Uncharacterized protein n=1 Tax=Actinoplanes campanulatus TaxID=113559 RepID=A0A7W5AEI6_9ACTN|nr:hypothetical protein [Actinoplanes campanulatus]
MVAHVACSRGGRARGVFRARPPWLRPLERVRPPAVELIVCAHLRKPDRPEFRVSKNPVHRLMWKIEVAGARFRLWVAATSSHASGWLRRHLDSLAILGDGGCRADLGSWLPSGGQSSPTTHFRWKILGCLMHPDSHDRSTSHRRRRLPKIHIDACGRLERATVTGRISQERDHPPSVTGSPRVGAGARRDRVAGRSRGRERRQGQVVASGRARPGTDLRPAGAARAGAGSEIAPTGRDGPMRRGEDPRTGKSRTSTTEGL